MILVKTAKGSAAMASRDEGLTAKARQVMVLSDGKRRRQDMELVFGPSCFILLDQLVAEGFLHEGSTAMAPRESEGLPRRPAQSLDASPATTVRHRRSSAGTKMYMIDLLQMMRNMDASSLAVSLHTSADGNELLDWVLVGLKFICSASGVSYGSRVYQRLLEIVPEHQLPKLEEFGSILFVPVAEVI